METLCSILLIYGMVSIFYFMYKGLSKILIYIIIAPVIVVVPFIAGWKEIKNNRKLTGYALLIAYGLLYLLLLLLIII